MVHSTPNGVLFSWIDLQDIIIMMNGPLENRYGYNCSQCNMYASMGRKCVTTTGTTVHYKIIRML